MKGENDVLGSPSPALRAPSPTRGEGKSNISSFVRRDGRITPAQRTALTDLWDKYVLSPEVPLIPEKIFGEQAPLVIEIGFGMGQSLLDMAKAYPEKHYIGIEVHRPGIGALMAGLEAQQITNVRIYTIDAVLVLKQCISFESISEVLIYFPDPWPKRRHHKRRLIQKEFIALVSRILKPGGILHCATDWEEYAHHMMSVLSTSCELVNTAGDEQFAKRPSWRPETKFERRGSRLGHKIYDLIFEKKYVYL